MEGHVQNAHNPFRLTRWIAYPALREDKDRLRTSDPRSFKTQGSGENTTQEIQLILLHFLPTKNLHSQSAKRRN